MIINIKIFIFVNAKNSDEESNSNTETIPNLYIENNLKDNLNIQPIQYLNNSSMIQPTAVMQENNLSINQTNDILKQDTLEKKFRQIMDILTIVLNKIDITEQPQQFLDEFKPIINKIIIKNLDKDNIYIVRTILTEIIYSNLSFNTKDLDLLDSIKTKNNKKNLFQYSVIVGSLLLMAIKMLFNLAFTQITILLLITTIFTITIYNYFKKKKIKKKIV